MTRTVPLAVMGIAFVLSACATSREATKSDAYASCREITDAADRDACYDQAVSQRERELRERDIDRETEIEAAERQRALEQAYGVEDRYQTRPDVVFPDR